jgi:predicted ATPase
MYHKEGIKFTAKAVFRTWEKNGYLFDLGEEGGWFICEYLLMMSPAIFVQKLSDIRVQSILQSKEKIVFGGYQPFEIDEDTDKPNEFFDDFLHQLYTKGLLSNNEEIDKFYRANILKHSDLNENIIEDKKSNNDFIINYLGVQNFRNIGNYQSFNLSPITFFTGKNNIGKSSVLKSFLFWSTLDYYFSFKKSTFFINSDFERSENPIVKRLNLDINTLFNNQSKSNVFHISLNLDYNVKKYPDKKLKLNFDFRENNEKHILELVCFTVDYVDNENYTDFIIKLKEVDDKNIFYLNTSVFDINIDLKSKKEFEYVFNEEFNGVGVFNSLFNINSEISLIDLFNADNSVPSLIPDNSEFSSLLSKIKEVIEKLLQYRPIEYIPSQRSENSRFYNSNTSYFGEVIEWLDENQSNSLVIKEINEWLLKFDLEKFTTEKVGLYKFILKIGEKHIADLGFGVMQLFSVIAGSIISKYKLKNIVIIEEPESNLHPNLQSKLADFFFEINKNHGVQFLIETHSEYLIRKTQLIGIENNLFQEDFNNPFGVIYFDKNQNYYKMQYTSDGRFEKDFGPGFFDVSSKLLKEIIKKTL